MQKGFAHLLLISILILLALGASAFYLLSRDPAPATQDKMVPPLPPTQEQKRQANIYKNDNLGLEFIIPENTSVVEETEGQFHKRSNGNMRKNFTGTLYYEPAGFVTSLYVLNSDKDFDNAPLSLWVFENPDNLDGEASYKKYWYYPFIWGDFTSAKNKIAPTEKIMVGEASGSGSLVGYQDSRFIYLPKGEKMYLFKVIGDTKILETFKYTK